MAEVIVLSIELEGGGKVVNTGDQIKATIKQINQELNKVKIGSDRYKELQKDLGALREVQKQVRADTRQSGREFVEASNKAQGSYRKMNAELVSLRKEFKELGKDARNGIAGKDLLNRIKTLDRELKDIDRTIGNSQRHVGDYGRAMNNASRQTGGFAKSLGGIKNLLFAGGVIGAVTATTRAVVNFTKELFTNAQAIQQQGIKNLAVLGEETLPLVEANANKLALALGLTTSQFTDFTANTADLLTPLGFTQQQAGELGQTFTTLSSVLANFGDTGASAEQVSKDLNSALTGRTEGIKKYGVVLKQSEVNAKLAALGIKDLNSEQAKQARTQLIANEILRQTENAQRAFFSEQEGLQTTQRKGLAALQDAFDKISQALTPFFSTILQGFADFGNAIATNVSPAIQFLSKLFAPIRKSFGELIDAFGLGEGAGRSFAKFIIDGFAGVLKRLAFTLNIVIKALTGIVTAIRRLAQSNTILGRWLRTIGNIVAKVIDIFNNIPAVFEGIRAALTATVNNISNGLRKILLDGQILIKRLQATFSDAAKEQLKELREQRAKLNEESQGIGEAFEKAFQDKKAELEIELKFANEAEAKEGIRELLQPTELDLSGGATSSGSGSGGVSGSGSGGVSGSGSGGVSGSGSGGGKQKTPLQLQLESIEKARLARRLEARQQIKDAEALASKLREIDRRSKAAQLKTTIEFSEEGSVQRLKAEEELEMLKTDLAAEFDRMRLSNRLDTEKEGDNKRIEQHNQYLSAILQASKMSSKEGIQTLNELFTKELAILFDLTKEQAQELSGALMELGGAALQGISAIGQEQRAQEAAKDQQSLENIEANFARRIELAQGNEERQKELEQALERERIRIARRGFERTKQADIQQALGKAALAIIQSLANTTLPFPLSLAAPAAIATVTGIQVAQIANRSFKAEKGAKVIHSGNTGFLGGKRHAQGGTDISLLGQRINAEKGEFIDFNEHGHGIIVNRINSQKFSPLLNSIKGRFFNGKGRLLEAVNMHGGHGIPFAQEGAAVFSPSFTPSLPIGNVQQATTVNVQAQMSNQQILAFAELVGQSVKEGSFDGTAQGISDNQINQIRQIELANFLQGINIADLPEDEVTISITSGITIPSPSNNI